MLDQVSMDAMVKACQNKLQVVLTYLKKTTGETVVHTVGIQEIGVDKKGQPCVWGFDVSLQDHIRIFLIDYIEGIQVLDTPYFPQGGYPIKINGEIIGY
jgi:hypothetical protein